MDTFLVSKQFNFVIPSGATGANVNPVDLGMNYAGIIITCENCTGVPATTTMNVQAGEILAGAMNTVYKISDPKTAWGDTIPTSGSYRILCEDAFGARKVRIVLNKAVTQSKTFVVYGVAGGSGG